MNKVFEYVMTDDARLSEYTMLLVPAGVFQDEDILNGFVYLEEVFDCSKVTIEQLDELIKNIGGKNYSSFTALLTELVKKSEAKTFDSFREWVKEEKKKSMPKPFDINDYFPGIGYTDKVVYEECLETLSSCNVKSVEDIDEGIKYLQSTIDCESLDYTNADTLFRLVSGIPGDSFKSVLQKFVEDNKVKDFSELFKAIKLSKDKNNNSESSDGTSIDELKDKFIFERMPNSMKSVNKSVKENVEDYLRNIG